MSERNRTLLNDLIVTDPGRMHGAPCFRGTRVPVELLWNDLRSGHSIEDFLAACPTVTRQQAETYLELAQDLLLECVAS